MREILFRGKRTDNNEWVYGSLVTMANETKYGKNAKVFSNTHIVEKKNLEIRSFARGCEVWSNNVMIQVDKTTIGQYTGLNDKNGVKIFEGDICINSDKSNYPRPLSVEWIDEFACFAFVDKGDFNNMYFYQKNHMENVAVIGNIHDNKDLIK